MSAQQLQVRFGGFGGQGIVLAGNLLGKAASLYDGKEAVFTQAYGPEARGGACRADVIVSNEPVDYPFVTQPDVLAAMFQEAYAKFHGDLRPGGTLIIEEDLVTPDTGETAMTLPATRIAEELGNRIVANVVVLGALVAQTGIVSPGSVEEAIRNTLKPAAVELNLRAFAAGQAFDGAVPLEARV